MTDEKQGKPPKAKASKPGKPKDAKPPASSSSSSSAKKSPAEWMNYLRLYAMGPRQGKRARVRIPAWQHAAAAALHGWGQHQHDAQAPIQLSETDYKKALEAVEGIPPYQPHKGALSEHCRHNFKG